MLDTGRRSRLLVSVRPEYEEMFRERLGALQPAPCTELVHVLMLPDFDHAARIEVDRDS
jgi:hypothetical protein